MRPIPRNPNWQQAGTIDSYDGVFEPYPIAREEEWFFTSLGMSRGVQSTLTTIAGVAGALSGLVSLIVLLSLAGSPSSASPDVIAAALLGAVAGFALGAAAFYTLHESVEFADIEACGAGVKVTASISIIAGALAAACIVLVAIAIVVALFALGAAFKNK